LSDTFAQTNSDLPSELDTQIFAGIRAIHNDRYGEALAHFDVVRKARPDHPAGYFFYGAALEWQDEDYRNFVQNEEFFSNMNLVVEKGKALLKKDSKNAWASFYIGAGYGFMGITSIKFGNWVKAFFDGQNGYTYLDKALKLKPDLYDGYFGLGQFHYWRSKKASIIRAFTLHDEMKMGIKELHVALTNGYYTVHEVRNSLVSIYWLEGEYDKSLALIAEAQAIFPDYLATYWALALNHMSTKEWALALVDLTNIEKKLRASKVTGPIAFIECFTWRASVYSSMGKLNEAKAAIKMARSVDPSAVKGIERYNELSRDLDRIGKDVGYKE
jgi:tetratricopeptide (TPR) repeat protein